MTCKGGIRTRDLLVMSQTSCQTALPCCIQMQFLGGSASVYVMRSLQHLFVHYYLSMFHQDIGGHFQKIFDFFSYSSPQCI